VRHRGPTRSNTVALTARTRRQLSTVYTESTARRVQKTGSNSANFMLSNCNNDHHLDQARSTTTMTSTRISTGSVVADSRRSRSAVSAARHVHSTSRPGSWQLSNLYRRQPTTITLDKEQQQQRRSSRRRPEPAQASVASHGGASGFGSGHLAPAASSVASGASNHPTRLRSTTNIAASKANAVQHSESTQLVAAATAAATAAASLGSAVARAGRPERPWAPVSTGGNASHHHRRSSSMTTDTEQHVKPEAAHWTSDGGFVDMDPKVERALRLAMRACCVEEAASVARRLEPRLRARCEQQQQQPLPAQMLARGEVVRACDASLLVAACGGMAATLRQEVLCKLPSALGLVQALQEVLSVLSGAVSAGAGSLTSPALGTSPLVSSIFASPTASNSSAHGGSSACDTGCGDGGGSDGGGTGSGGGGFAVGWPPGLGVGKGRALVVGAVERGQKQRHIGTGIISGRLCGSPVTVGRDTVQVRQTPRTVERTRRRLIGGDSSDSSDGADGGQPVELMTRRSIAQQARARAWRVLERWAALCSAVCHCGRQSRCLGECVQLLRHLSLVRNAPAGRPVLRACRAARQLQSAWRLVPYRRSEDGVRSVMTVQRMVRRVRLDWVRRVAQLAVSGTADVFVCAPCGRVCSGEAALIRHCMSDSHICRSGSRGFCGCLPGALGTVPRLSNEFFQQLSAACAGAETSAAVSPHTAAAEAAAEAGAVSVDLLSLHMRCVTAMAPAIAAAGAAWMECAAARVARVTAVVASSPRTMERWRVGLHSGRIVYYDTVSQTSQWTHPLTGSSVRPLVAVADAVVAQRMWPAVGSPWEVAVAATGGVCYRHTNTDAVQWAPPPGSQVDPAGPTYPPPVGSVVPDASCGPLRLGPPWGGAVPPEHVRLRMLASPVAEGEREPRWFGQWDVVAREHVFIHRVTHAVRSGPWVSMPSAEGRIYYLNLRTAWSRWDPPPLWEAGWVRRASQTWVAANGCARIPSAVPRGREVCGGAPVGVDVLAALGPCVEQMMLGLAPDGQWAADCGKRLADLARAFSSRFSLPYPSVVAALTPGEAGAGLPSAPHVTRALLSVLVAAGAGFQAYA
jgi:uncharacterized membrane protein YgcG